MKKEQPNTASPQTSIGLNKLTKHLPGVVFQLRLRPDGSLCIPYASKGLKDIYRIAPQDVREDASEFFAKLHPDDQETYLNGLKTSAEHLNPWLLEYRLQFADEPQRWLLVNALPLKEADGSVLWHGLITDIDERKQQELQLYKYKAIIESTDDAIISKNLQGVIQSWNSGAERIFGFAAREAIGQPMKILMSDDRLSEEIDILKRIGSGQRIDHFETVLRHKDGRLINISATISPILDSEGNIIGASNIARDITEQKRAEAELRIAAAAFETQEGIVITDPNHVIIRVNGAFSRITGYRPEEVIGKDMSLLNSQRHDPNLYASIKKTLQHHDEWQGEMWNKLKNGEVHPQWVTITAVKDSSGRIVNYVGTNFDITDRKLAEEEIRHLAYYDQLTQLPNRRLLLDRLSQAISSSSRNNQYGALLFIDMDNFKNLNDTLGHDYGDMLLQQVAQRLSLCIREEDTVARLGGDEFVVMLENMAANAADAANQAETVGNKILHTLNQVYLLGNHAYKSTPSIGITLFNNQNETVDTLIKRADIAMYQAKAAGRNTLRFFDPEMQALVTARGQMEKDLKLALEGDQFWLYLQLQINHKQQIVGAEALIRWQHPQYGLVSPPAFISIAEESGMILPIGKWLLETACTQLKLWQQQTHTADLVLSINLSSKQFYQADFCTQIQNLIGEHAINPKLLKFELTESLLLEDIEKTIVMMHNLKAIGVQFSLDDFGTGYSSLKYLKQLPLDQLKIDPSFVQDITNDSNHQAVVRTIIAMGQALEVNVIAEGVETEEQQSALAAYGCFDYQGYLYGKPVPAQQFQALL